MVPNEVSNPAAGSARSTRNQSLVSKKNLVGNESQFGLQKQHVGFNIRSPKGTPLNSKVNRKSDINKANVECNFGQHFEAEFDFKVELQFYILETQCWTLRANPEPIPKRSPQDFFMKTSWEATHNRFGYELLIKTNSEPIPERSSQDFFITTSSEPSPNMFSYDLL